MTTPGLPPVCILAGGRGTRLGQLAEDTPKPLVMVAGKPFLAHQLGTLARHGARKVVVCVGYLGERIEAALGRRFGEVGLEYSYDGDELAGTLGALRNARERLGGRFLVLYGDTYLRIDYGGFATAWKASGCMGAMAVLHNAGRWGTSNASYAHDRVLSYDKFCPSADMTWIDYGLGGLTTTALDRVPPAETDLAVLYSALAAGDELFGFTATRRFYEIGTPGALRRTERFLSSPHHG